MSLIHYKFKAAKDYNSLTFDGLSISLFELKRDILIDNKLKGADFDLIISNAQTNEDYYDDTQLIPKNTSVYVRRVPAKPGGTNAQQYLTAGAPATAGGQSSKRALNNRGGMLPLPVPEAEPTELGLSMPLSLDGVLPGESEEDKLKALFDQSSMQWDQQLQPTGTSQGYRTYQGNSYRNAPPQGKPLSANYICHRCGIRGHYVQNCPTIGDKSLNQPKVRRTTGIPRSFLKNIDSIPEGKGAMITNDGALVVAQTNDAAWKKFQLNQRGSGFSAEELRESVPVPPGLECFICNKLLNGAVSVPCCKKLFCHECISEELLNKPPASQFICPNCHTRDIVPDSLIAEQNKRNQVDERLRLWAMEREGDLGESEGEYLVDRQSEFDINSNKFPDSEPQLFTPTTDHDLSYEFHYAPGQQADFDFRDGNFDSHHYHSDLSLEGQFVAPLEPVPFEMPPLRWTPDGGISGHINIPPIEMLSNGANHQSDFDPFSGRGRDQRDRRGYRGTKQNLPYRRNRQVDNRMRSPFCSPSPDRHPDRHPRSGPYHRDSSASVNIPNRRHSRVDYSSYSQKLYPNETHSDDRVRRSNTDYNYTNERRSNYINPHSPPRRSHHSRSPSNDIRSISPIRRGRQSRSVSRHGKDSSTRRSSSHIRESKSNRGRRHQIRSISKEVRPASPRERRVRRSSSSSRSRSSFQNRVASPRERRARRSRSRSKNRVISPRERRDQTSRSRSKNRVISPRERRDQTSRSRSKNSVTSRERTSRRSRSNSKNGVASPRERRPQRSRSNFRNSPSRRSVDQVKSTSPEPRHSRLYSDESRRRHPKSSYDQHGSPVGTTHRSENRSDNLLSFKKTGSKRAYKDLDENSVHRHESSRRSPMRSSRSVASPNDNIYLYDDKHGGSDSHKPISNRLGKKVDSGAHNLDILSRIGPTRDRSLTSRIGGRVDLNRQSAESSQSKRRRNRNRSDRLPSPDVPKHSIRIAHISKRS